MTVGIELADARQRLGLSLEDISARTKISVERLSAIEQGDLDRLPAAVYLNGFLRAYAAEVNLDPEDLTRRYLAELEHASLIDPMSAGALASNDAAVSPALNEFDESERASDVELARPRASATAPPVRDPDVIRPERFEPHEVAPVLFAVYPPTGATPRRRYGAIVAVLAVAAVFGVLLSANFDLLRKQFGDWSETNAVELDATASDRSAPVVPPASPRPEPPPPPADAARQIDPPIAGAPDAAAANADDRRAVNDDRRVDADRDARVDTTTAEATNGTRQAPKRTVEPDSSDPAEADPRDLSGWWTLTNRVESTSYGAFDKLNLGYRLRLQQRGNRVTGTGQKWMENGKPLPASRRTPIAIEGTRNGRRLELTFTEKGALRVSGGTFVMEVAADGTLYGTFASDAANAQGSSLARRASSLRD